MADILPPLQTLRAFEATGRRLSMTLAAEELHLTHGAVSRQIRTLEDHLGVPLFRRMTRRIELTEVGQSFFSTVTRLLSELSRESEDIRRRNDTNRLVVSCGVSFASKWLTSRLHRLMGSHPDLDIHLEVTDAPVDFSSGHVDVALRYGNGQYPVASAERIMNEIVSPVCTPEYRDKMGLHRVEDLARCQLIHEIGMPTTWERWFAIMQLPYPGMRGPGYSHGSMSIEAAIRAAFSSPKTWLRAGLFHFSHKLGSKWNGDMISSIASVIRIIRRSAFFANGSRRKCASSRRALGRIVTAACGPIVKLLS